MNGFLALLLLLVILGGMIFFAFGIATEMIALRAWWLIFEIPAFIIWIICMNGLFMVNPNEARVMQFFGAYAGTVLSPGLRWANPFYSKKRVSLRVRNFETEKLKVNDHDGNPIEIGAVVVWKVVDTAEALFEVDDFEHYVNVQSEAAIRNLATRYSYDAHGPDDISLRANTEQVAEMLQKEIQDRLEKAGVNVVEARISHLAYASEIAGAMLRRQQAAAVIAARQKIVEGAVGMVEMALKELSDKDILDLDPEKKANLVGNLLIVLCGEHDAKPVVNAGN